MSERSDLMRIYDGAAIVCTNNTPWSEAENNVQNSIEFQFHDFFLLNCSLI